MDRAKSFIDKNRAAMVDFMEDALRVVRWYIDPKNHDGAVAIASKLTKLPPERFTWLFTDKDYARNSNLMPDLKALQANVDQDLGARLLQGEARRAEVFGSQHRPGGGGTIEVTEAGFSPYQSTRLSRYDAVS